jgi:exonuclease III
MSRVYKVRIVVWNCRMGFAKKREVLYALEPDVAVVPECSQDAAKLCADDGYSTCWWGDNKNKGLAVIAAKPWALKTGSPPTQKWVAPVTVSGPIPFKLIAVWACRVGDIKEFNYIGQVFEAVNNHRRWFSDELPTVVCGDFNSNAIFRPRKIRNHNAVVSLLDQRNIVSAYHAFFSEEHGEETKPTHYFWHQKSRPFHIDYVFLPNKWIPTAKVTVGTYRKWRPLSDHVPLIVDVSTRA